MKGLRPESTTKPTRESGPTSKRIYETLRRAMMHGDLRAGTKLGEAEVGAQLGVSRTPVREAFAELLNQGLLEEGARRQLVIVTPSHGLVEEIRLMRDALEPVLVRRAAATMDVSDVDQLRLIMIRARRVLAKADIESFFDCDEDFHLHIPHATGLRLAEDSLRRLRGLNRIAAQELDWNQADLTRIADEHDAIVEALSDNDEERAAEAMEAHLATSGWH